MQQKVGSDKRGESVAERNLVKVGRFHGLLRNFFFIYSMRTHGICLLCLVLPLTLLQGTRR